MRAALAVTLLLVAIVGMVYVSIVGAANGTALASLLVRDLIVLLPYRATIGRFCKTNFGDKHAMARRCGAHNLSPMY